MAKKKPQALLRQAMIAAAVFTVVFVILYVIMLTRLVNLGQSKAFLLIALVPPACSAAVFLFLVADSFAEFTGPVLGGTLKLGGPPVVFFGILLIGMNISDSRAFSQTVHLQLPDHQTGSIHGQVVLRLPTGSPAVAQVGEHNTAVVTNLSREFAGQSVVVTLDAPGYELVEPSKSYPLNATGPIVLPVRPDVAPLIVRGFVLSHAYQRPIADAAVTVDDQTVQTDAQGKFEASFAPAAGVRTLSLRVHHPDYKTQQRDVSAMRIDSPDLSTATVTIRLEPKP